ncbi:MAG: hypothetical protein HFJ48_05110 [Clostridia bacterium]|nr:hypothetical protein [Clostridia bacterium]
MDNNKDYIVLMDIAKMNLSEIINSKMKEYKRTYKLTLKKEIIELLKDRKQLFLFDEKVIEKYI